MKLLYEPEKSLGMNEKVLRVGRVLTRIVDGSLI
jgi:hypothetical protein